MDAKKEILDAIEVMVNQAIENSTAKIYTGVCKIIHENNCIVSVNGRDNTVKYFGSTPIIGKIYKVFVPFNNMSSAFIIVPGIGKDEVTGVDSVNGKTGSVVLEANDVGALPVNTFIPTKTSELNNDSGFITESQTPVKSVDGEVGNVVTNSIKFVQQGLTESQKQQARVNIGAGVSSFDGDYNSLNNLPTIPSKTSQLSNDSDFITSSALEPYAKKTEIPVKVSQIENDNGYITEEQAKNAAPVQSVNGDTGNITISTDSIGAIPVSDITQTLGTSTDKVPSEKAIIDALTAAGYGDMLKAVYDPNSAVANAGGISNYLSTNGLKIRVQNAQPGDLITGDFWFQVE